VTPIRLSFWDRAQLRLLRLQSLWLGLMDALFHVQWGERLLSRMAARWQSQLAQLREGLEFIDAALLPETSESAAEPYQE
jgi:hypothetical protein